MMKKMKTLLSLFLVLAMVISPLSSAGVFAAEDELALGVENPDEQEALENVSVTEPSPVVVNQEEEKSQDVQEEEKSSDVQEKEEEKSSDEQVEKDEQLPPDAEEKKEDSSEEQNEKPDVTDTQVSEIHEQSQSGSGDVLMAMDANGGTDDTGSNAANIRVLKEDGTEYKMFTITDSSAVLQGDQIAITISTNNTSYSKLYFGSFQDTDKSPVWSGTPKDGGGWTFRFTIDAVKGGTNVPVLLWLESSGAWSDKALTMTIPDMGYVAPAPGDSGTPDDSKDPEPEDDAIKAMYGDMSKEFSMFKIAKSTASVDGNEIAAEIYVSPAASGKFTYSKIYLGNKEDFGNGAEATEVTGEITADNLQKYVFRLPLSMQGKNQSFVPVKADGSGYVSKDLVLTIPDFGVKVPDITPIPSVTPVPTETPTPTPDPFESEITSLQVVKDSDGEEFKMFKIVEYSLTNDGKNLTITLSTTSKSFDKLYFGSFNDEPKTPIITGTSYNDTGWTFTFTLPAAMKNSRIPILLGYADSSKGWYQNSDGAYSLYLAIPDVKVTEVTPTPIPDPAPEAGITVMTGGSNNSYRAIKILSSTAELSSNGKEVNCSVTFSGTAYDRIYFGDRTDAEKESVIYGVSDGTNTTFTYSVPAEKQGMNILFTPGKTDGAWDTTQDLLISVPNINRTFDLDSYKDGEYDIYGNATTYNHKDQPGTNPIDKGSTLTIHGDVITLTWITRSNIDKIYIGDAGDSESVKEANAIYSSKIDESNPYSYRKFVVTLPKEVIGGSVPYVAHSAASGWSANQNRLEIGQFIEYTGETEVPDPTPTVTPTPTPDPGTELEDGVYNVPTVTTGEQMFRVVYCQLTSKNGKLTAQIALSGTGYDYLYMGTKQEAYAADSSSWIPYTIKDVLNNETGKVESKYVYEIPVSALDTPLTVASRSSKYASQNKGVDAWINRTITITSEGIKRTGDLPKDPVNPTPTPPVNPTPTDTPEIDSGSNGGTTKPSGNDGKADEESKYESDLSGRTSKVDSSTGLADGVYTPDSFSWSGGTGRVKISCNKVTVKNGQAYATIVFSSSSYSYVKANGRTYYGTVSGGSTSFTIPVALNKNNTIIGMTTKMSAAHEVEYSIYVYLAAAAKADGTAGGTSSDVVIGAGKSSNNKLDEEAPQIIGLTYESETKLDYAEYFKIYHYQDGITLLEVDMTKDTARDPEKLDAEEQDKDQEKSGDDEKQNSKDVKNTDVSVDMEEGSETSEESDEEKAAELYMGNVVKYLIVPEDTEIPVGLEKEVIVIDLPVDKTYVASKEALSTMDELELLDTVQALGFEKEDCPNEKLAEALDEEEISFAGTFDDIDYKALLRAQCNLSIMPSELLPRDEEQDQKVSDEKTLDSEKNEDEKETDEEKKLTVDEQTERLQEIADRHAMLWVPMLVDRSADEKTELAQYEWIKVYGAIFNCGDETAKLFDQVVKAAEKGTANEK